MLDFTALWGTLGLGEVVGEDAGHGPAEVPVGELVLDDGTAGATLQRQIEETLDDVRVTVLGSPLESVDGCRPRQGRRHAPAADRGAA